MMKAQIFALGQICTTPGASHACNSQGVSMLTLLARHQSGDWGDVDPEDAQANEQALVDGERIMSVYLLPDGQRCWLLTEADRSYTTFLLPEDY